MKIEITGTVDGKLIGTAIFEDGKITSATFGEGMAHTVDAADARQTSALGAAVSAAVKAFRSAMTPATAIPVHTDNLPKPLIVGDTVTEPGNYYAISQQQANLHAISKRVWNITQSGNEAAIDALLEAVSGIKLPEPPAEESPAPEEPTEPNEPADPQ